MAADAPNWLFSLFAFTGFILASIPFSWHLQCNQVTFYFHHLLTDPFCILAWNTGTCLYMAWTALGCLNGFINSIVWNGNAINWAPVWCDICKLTVEPNHSRSLSNTSNFSYSFHHRPLGCYPSRIPLHQQALVHYRLG